MKHSIAGLVLLGAVVLPASPAAAACDVTVRITGYAPARFEVARGGTVTWCWAEGNHSVTGTFANSGVRAKDATFTHTFAAVGTFEYVCMIHESMTGQVVVEQAAATTPPASKSPSPSPKPSTKPPTTPARTTSPVPRAQASTTPAVIPTSPPASATPTQVLTTAPATTEPPTITTPPSPSPTTVADIDPAPAKPKTGLAVAVGLVVAAGALGGAAWLLLRGRGA